MKNYDFDRKKMPECNVFAVQSVHDFYNFQVNHMQYYVNGKPGFYPPPQSVRLGPIQYEPQHVISNNVAF